MIEIARRFAAYIPVTLARQILEDGLPEPGQPRPLLAATLFSDISGFTKMSEELASDGPRGAEELNRVLLTTFTAMIDLIHEMGGAVSHFYGDAMSVYFPETAAGDAALRALACAQLMQKLMASSFDRAVTNRPPGKDPIFPLTIKIGAGYGRCQEIVVGDPDATLEFVLTGTAVDESAAAEKKAQSGQVVASAHVLAQAGLGELCADDYCVLTDRVPVVMGQPVLDWPAYDETALSYLIAAAGSLIPDAIVQRLERGGRGEIAEHRPVTSLFVDFALVGDVDETSDVETAVHGKKLHEYYLWAARIVARFGGQNARVNRILTGDKGNQLHIIFGAPVAPDAPEQAIRCAMTMIREKPDFIDVQRIGLAAGKVFAGPVGSTTRREYTVVGDMVNLSARLAQVCHENCIFTNSITAGRVDNWIEFEVLPPVPLKGKQVAVSPYRPTGERSGTTQLQVYFSHWERPLVGRELELDLLLGGMDAALHNIGGVAAILGAVGVGKTRLLAEGIRYWLDEGGTGLVGVAQQHKSDVPYDPWLDIWRDFFNLRVDMSAAVQAEHVVAQTQALVPDVGDDIALWGDVLSLPVPGQEHLLELSAEVRQARFFSLVRRCFVAYGDLTPLLIILEDAHWADQSSLALLDEVTKNLDDRKLFFAVTFRLVDELKMDMLNRPSCVPILLTDLSPAHARDLLAHLVGVPQLSQSVEQHLGLRDREGRDSPVSPLFLEESVNVMISAGVLEVNGQVRVHEERLQALQIPDTIHGLLLARLDRLPPAGRDLLQVASVIGRQFALEPLHNIASDLPEQHISTLLEELSSEDITRLVTSDPEWIYLFQHALTHEVAYESLPYARRQLLHHAMADWLVKRYEDNLRPYYPILAYHYSQAGNHEAGLKYALAAGTDARDLFSNQEALEFFNLAEEHLLVLGEEENWETAVELYLDRANVLILLSDFNAAFRDADLALELARVHQISVSMAIAFNLMAEISYRRGDFYKVQTLSKQVISILNGNHLADNQLARAYIWAGWAASSQLEYETALEYLQIARTICTDINDSFRLAMALEAMAFVYYGQRKLDLALSTMQEGVRLSRSFSTQVNIGFALNNIAFMAFEAGMPLQALETFTEAITLGRETSRNLLAIALYNQAAVHAYLGGFSASLAGFEEASDLLEPDQHVRQWVEMNLYWGLDYCCALGLWEDAAYRLRQAELYIAERPESFPEERVRLNLGLGQIELNVGDLKQAETYFTLAYTLVKEKKLTWWTPAVHYFLGLVACKNDDLLRAKTYFDDGLKASTSGGSLDFKPLLLLELAQLEAAGSRVQVDLLEESIYSTEQRARFVDRIDCLRRAGNLLADSNQIELQNMARQYQERSAFLEQQLRA